MKTEAVLQEFYRVSCRSSGVWAIEEQRAMESPVRATLQFHSRVLSKSLLTPRWAH